MHQSHLLAFTRTAVSAAAAIVICAPALAQNTTAALGGRVTDSGGAAVAGATVTILHVQSGSTNRVTTDADGRYVARGLRVGGPYTVTVERGGTTERRDNVFLTLAETTSLDLALGTQTIVVTGQAASQVFNRANMGAGTNIGSRELNALGSIQRNLQDYARTDPRLAQTDKERGEISALGQNTRFNSITIDGVTTNDTFGLEANNLPTIKQPISIDAIESVQVNLSNYDVTQKGYTGANINAVTKSGTNEFKGSVFYVTRDDSLAGKRFNRTTGEYSEPPKSEDKTMGFTLGGPILKDKLFFFGAYEEYTSSRNSPTFGPLGSALTNVGITQASIDRAIEIARDQWGMDVGSSEIPDGLEVKVKDTLLKLDWNITDDHRASVRYTKTEQTEPTLNGFSPTGLSLSSWWFNQVKSVESVVGQWFGDWTPTFSTELKVSQRDYESQPFPLNGVRLPAVGLRFSGALPPDAPSGVSANNRFLNFGTENSRHFNVLETKTTDIYGGATWTLGAHEIKFGLDFARNEVFNAFVQNVFGNYTFGCEPGTYSFGVVASCTGNYTPTGGAPTAMTSALRDQAVLENFERGLPSSYTLAGPRAGLVIDDAAAVWRSEQLGLFVQDTFRVTPKFNVMVGVRMDQLNMLDKPIANAAAAAPRVAGQVTGASSVTRDTGGFGLDNTVTPDGTSLFQPRVGFNWNLGTPQQPMQVRGGFGLFQGAAANVWLSNPYSNNGMAATTFSCTTFGACNTPSSGDPVGFSPDPDDQPRPSSTPPAANIDFFSKSMEQPSVWKANLAFETMLPALPVVGRLTASAEWVHTKVKSGLFYRHLNLGNPTRTGTDGRDLYWMPQSYSPDCWNGSNLVTTAGTPCAGGRDRALSNPAFGRNVLLVDSTSKGGGDALTLAVSAPAGAAGIGWSLAYTVMSAKEVSPLTSSTSSSNWGNRSIFNQNEEVLQNSNYLIRNRVNANMTWGKNLLPGLRTSVGVFYEGRRGKPYSWTYINDLNGDGVGGNDLMYIPSAPGSGEVVFRGGQAEEDRFWEIVNANPALSGARGGVVGRNNAFAPWVNSFDVRFSQELPGFTKGHKASLTLDIFNFGNLLNKKWGRINEIGFPSNRSFVNFNGLDADGRYVYSLGSLEDYTTRQQAGESQWAAQVTLKYEF